MTPSKKKLAFAIGGLLSFLFIAIIITVTDYLVDISLILKQLRKQ